VSGRWLAQVARSSSTAQARLRPCRC
jgi:hypothetical protein